MSRYFVVSLIVGVHASGREDAIEQIERAFPHLDSLEVHDLYEEDLSDPGASNRERL
jgi:hypothetical protein